MSQDPVLISKLASAVESELQRQIDYLDTPELREFHTMLTYHMGWTGKFSGPHTRGKRIRPILALLTIEACDVDWQPAVPAAAAIELVHNFSLVHDDIQDNSELRHGRPTVWKKWGIAQGVNAGDALFAISNIAMHDIVPSYPASTAIEAERILHSACLALTRGQFKDMWFEKKAEISIQDYLSMISDKTAALFKACTDMGALLGGAEQATRSAYNHFGECLGLAFQIRDDYLGIWGDLSATGKSAESDLMAGKRTLPIIYGLEISKEFNRLYDTKPMKPDLVQKLADILELEGVKSYIGKREDELLSEALDSLRQASPKKSAEDAFIGLINKLSGRLG